MRLNAQASPTTFTVHVPMKFAMRDGKKTVITQIPSIVPRSDFNSAMIKALARAYRWRTLIENGEYSSITELADAKGINQSYACRLLRLTLLAPDIVGDILDGRHSLGLTSKEAKKPFAIGWAEQRKRDFP